MTLTLELRLDTVKMYHHPKNVVYLCQGFLNVWPEQTKTETEYENITFPHTPAGKMVNYDEV